jgi:hypothetical protein
MFCTGEVVESHPAASCHDHHHIDQTFDVLVPQPAPVVAADRHYIDGCRCRRVSWMVTRLGIIIYNIEPFSIYTVLPSFQGTGFGNR